MKYEWRIGGAMVAMVVAMGMSAVLAASALAHCDSTGGPLIPEAKAALERGDVTPVLKWVGPGDEAAIKAVFAQTVAVRAKSPEAKALVDQHFLETLVRLHRAGEGAPFTGITDAPAEPITAMADQALAAGSADAMIKALDGHMAEIVREKYAQAAAARQHKDESVEAGREYVAAYVTYVHYVENLHAAIIAAGAHHAESGQGAEGHGH